PDEDRIAKQADGLDGSLAGGWVQHRGALPEVGSPWLREVDRLNVPGVAGSEESLALGMPDEQIAPPDCCHIVLVVIFWRDGSPVRAVVLIEVAPVQEQELVLEAENRGVLAFEESDSFETPVLVVPNSAEGRPIFLASNRQELRG